MARKSPAAILKSKGLIPSDWNPRKLTSGQKSWVTKLTQKGRGKTRQGNERLDGPLRPVVKRPGEFSTVSAKSKPHKKQAASAGLPVYNKKAVVHTGKGGRVRRTGDKLTISSPERRQTLWFANAKNFDKTIARARNRKLKNNQVWTFQIGNNGPATKATRNLDELLKYLNDKDDWHSPDATEYISLVLIEENRSHVIKRLAVSNDQEEED